MPNKLQYVDHHSLNDFAAFLEAAAEQVREQAQANARRPEQEMSGAVNFMLRTPRTVERHLLKGCTLAEAIELTANESGLPADSVKRAWQRFTHQKSNDDLRRRNRLIIELAALGFSDSDIGKKVNLHRNSVNRIINQARRIRHMSRAAGRNIELVLNGGMLPPSDRDIF